MNQIIKRNLPIIGAAVRNIIVFTAVLSIPLASAKEMGLSTVQTSGWVFALYGIPSIFSLILTLYYQQPIVFTGNLFVIIFISRLGSQFSFAELVGAGIVAGAVVLVITGLGLSNRLSAWIPMPVVFGLLAGAVLPFVAGLFTQAGISPVLVWGILLVYLASRALFGSRIPAILPALLAGLAIAALTGQLGQAAGPLTVVVPEITPPVFSLPAIVAVSPVLVILIVLQANLPALKYLQSQDYPTPNRVIDSVSGFSTMLGSLFGPTGVSLSLPVASLVAGEEAGEHSIRHRSVYLAAGAALLVGVLAGIAAHLPEILPPALLLGLAGLAVVDVLASALQRITRGPLLLGPLFAFAIALSEISLLGFGSFFWALVTGTAVSLLLERQALEELREQGQT